jgi:uracil-DNA glycosylase family 4
MENKTDADQFLGLAQDVREHVSYLRELGIEHSDDLIGSQPIEDPIAKEGPIVKATDSIPLALRRNAEIAKPAIATPPAPAAGVFSGPTVQDRLPRPPTRQPLVEAKPAPTRLQAGLFGDVAPLDQVAIPDSTESLQDIWTDIGACKRCPLWEGRTQVVNSEGNHKARLMFVGEAPGADEDAQGRPFVGRAGQLLNKMMEAIGIKRQDVMIGNINRCRPPQNRTPTLSEATICRPFLHREIAAIRPEVVVVLGNTAVKNLLEAKEGITRIRGRFQNYKGIKVMPTFHPAYLLRDPSKKRDAWEDLKIVKAHLENSESPADES